MPYSRLPYLSTYLIFHTSCVVLIQERRLFEGGVYLKFGHDKECYCINYGVMIFCIKLMSNRIKTESIRNLSNFNFQWTKTLHQNNLNNIKFSLHFSRDTKLVICNNTKDYFSWVP